MAETSDSRGKLGAGGDEFGLREACASFGLGYLGWQLSQPTEETGGE